MVNVVASLSISFSTGIPSFMQVTRTTIKSGVSFQFDSIRVCSSFELRSSFERLEISQ